MMTGGYDTYGDLHFRAQTACDLLTGSGLGVKRSPVQIRRARPEKGSEPVREHRLFCFPAPSRPMYAASFAGGP